MTLISYDKALTELEAEYAKLQEQLHCTNEENNLLEQYLEEIDSSRVLWIKIIPCWKTSVVRIIS